MIDVRPDGFVVLGRERAKPLAPDERRAAIIDAVIPLLRAHGSEVSTRQIAEAAGIAEGTIFRAFGDKESLIAAAVQRYFDPEPLRNALRGIDPDDPADEKVHQVLHLLRERFTGVVGFMSAMGMRNGPPPGVQSPGDTEWLEIIARIFREDELNVSTVTLGHYMRLVAFGSAIPPINAVHPFTTEELVALVVRGVLPTPSRTGKKKN
ncbi:MAG TPA: TetR/AcrR family transcriptional regulator [Pseudolysinimonas sp.]